MIRLAHLSDIHICTRELDWQFEDWFNKRLTSWFNYRILGRARRFRNADEVLGRLIAELPGRGIDHVVFSGDATALGFATELRRAADLLRVSQPGIPGLAVPGNHDYCTRAAAASGDFERTFAPWQQGLRIDQHPYPFAQRAGPVWLIGVNAATGNRMPWDACGSVGAEQLGRLRQLLARLEPGLKLLVLHYPACKSNGEREPKYHRLRDLDDVSRVALEGGVNLWLHGHRHHPYHRQDTPRMSIPVICAGTATQQGIWSYGEYTIADRTLQAVRRAYDPAERCFRDAETFTLQMTS
jgi:3',5'-cyclic AMP phosphodiesterase CpdA